MSKPSLAGREHQQSSPFGLRHKQAKKNTEQTRHSCAISKKIRSKCAVSAPYPKKIRSKRATVAPYFSCVTRATRPLAHAAIPGVELTLPKPLAFAKGQKQPQVL